MRKNLSLDELSYVLNAPLLATLATNYPDGTTLLSPVWLSGAMAASRSSFGTTIPRRGRLSAIHV